MRSRILNHLVGDPHYQKIKFSLQAEVPVATKSEEYTLEKDRLLRYKGRVYVPKDDDIQNLVIKEAHQAPYVAHLGVQKMYADLKQLFFWAGMKKDIAKFVTRCLEC